MVWLVCWTFTFCIIHKLPPHILRLAFCETQIKVIFSLQVECKVDSRPLSLETFTFHLNFLPSLFTFTFHLHFHCKLYFSPGWLQSWLPPRPLSLVVDFQQLPPAQHRRSGLAILKKSLEYEHFSAFIFTSTKWLGAFLGTLNLSRILYFQEYHIFKNIMLSGILYFLEYYTFKNIILSRILYFEKYYIFMNIILSRISYFLEYFIFTQTRSISRRTSPFQASSTRLSEFRWISFKQT